MSSADVRFFASTNMSFPSAFLHFLLALRSPATRAQASRRRLAMKNLTPMLEVASHESPSHNIFCVVDLLIHCVHQHVIHSLSEEAQIHACTAALQQEPKLWKRRQRPTNVASQHPLHVPRDRADAPNPSTHPVKNDYAQQGVQTDLVASQSTSQCPWLKAMRFQTFCQLSKLSPHAEYVRWTSAPLQQFHEVS